MSRRCELTNVGVQSGNNVSHSHRKTRRRFLPNLQTVSLKSDVLNRVFRFKITAATLRSVDHNGGLDNFLLTATQSKLSPLGRKLKTEIKKARQASGQKGAVSGTTKKEKEEAA